MIKILFLLITLILLILILTLNSKKEDLDKYSLIPFTSVNPRKGKTYSVRLLQSKKICKDSV